MTPFIELKGLRKAYNEGRPNQFWAVDGIDLGLEAGRVTVFTGPSGSGKTTLLSLIACLARPTEGRVLLAGEAISALPEHFVAALRRRTFGFVFQHFNLIRGLSVLENTMLPAYPLGPNHHELHRRAAALLSHLGLAQRLNAPVESLSGGEAQRTALARALINDPPVIIADEPTANLDSHLSGAFLALVAELRDQGRTVLITSHDPLVYHSPVVDRLIAVRDGRLE